MRWSCRVFIGMCVGGGSCAEGGTGTPIAFLEPEPGLEKGAAGGAAAVGDPLSVSVWFMAYSAAPICVAPPPERPELDCDQGFDMSCETGLMVPPGGGGWLALPFEEALRPCEGEDPLRPAECDELYPSEFEVLYA